MRLLLARRTPSSPLLSQGCPLASPLHLRLPSLRLRLAASLAPARPTAVAPPTTARPRPLRARLAVALADHQQTRDHSGHHHHHHGLGHAHSHGADPYLTSKDRTDPGVRITRVGLYVNLAMVVSKGIGGWVFNSQALVADAFHAMTDMVSDIMTLATVSFALKPPTARFPNGYGKIECLGSLGVSSLLFFGGVAMGYASLLHLLADFAPALAAYLPHLHAHEHSHGVPDLNAAWLAAGSIIVKEWLYRATMKIARAKKSSVLASNAIHHRVDSLTAIIALLAIGASNVFPGASWLDPVGGLLVSFMVMNAGWGNTRQALEELADSALDSEARHSIQDAIRSKTPSVLDGRVDLRSVEGIKSGQNYLVDLVVATDPSRTVAELEGVEAELRSALMDVRGVWRVKVRFVRSGSDGASEFVGLGRKPTLENGKADSKKL